jgi:hypothetical protein
LYDESLSCNAVQVRNSYRGVNNYQETLKQEDYQAESDRFNCPHP